MEVIYITTAADGKSPAVTHQGVHFALQVLKGESLLDVTAISILAQDETIDPKKLEQFVNAETLKACRDYIERAMTLTDIERSNYATELNVINIYGRQLKQLVESEAVVPKKTEGEIQTNIKFSSLALASEAVRKAIEKSREEKEGDDGDGIPV